MVWTLGAGAAAASEVLSGPVAATVLDIIDGDTLAVRAHIWLGQSVETRVRLAGIDTPELRGRCPEETAMAERVRETVRVLVGDGAVTLRDVRYGTYAGRVVARIETGAGLDLAEHLGALGLAQPYGGRGARPDWCALIAERR